MDFSHFIAELNKQAQETLEHIRQAFPSFTKEEKSITLHSAHSSYFSYWLQQAQQFFNKNMLIVTPTDEQAYLMAQDFHLFGKEVSVLPSWKGAIGSGIAQYSSIWAERATSLHAIAHNNPSIVLCSVRSFFQMLPSKENIKSMSLFVQKEQSLDSTELIDTLNAWGYTRVSQVESFGEFAVRGEVIDICSDMYNKKGVGIRINIAYDVVEQIREFSLNSQLSTHSKTSIHLHPQREFSWQRDMPHIQQDENVNMYKQCIKQAFPEINTKSLITLVEKIETTGYEDRQYLYYPFLQGTYSHITQYFEETPLVVYTQYEMYQREQQRFWDELEQAFLSFGRVYPIPRASRLRSLLDDVCTIDSSIMVYATAKQKDSIRIADAPNKHFASNMTYFIKHCQKMCNKDTNKVFVCAENEDRLKQLGYLCTEKLTNLENFSIICADFSHGFSLTHTTTEHELQVFTEIDIFGRRMVNVDSQATQAIFSMDQMQVGEYVVHILYGIGAFNGIVRRTIRGIERDYIHLEYAKKEKLFVPIEQMNMVQRYIGQNAEQVQLDSLGSDSWQKRKKAVQKKIEDMSHELLELYAKRSSSQGIGFSKIDWEEQFLQDFVHEDTKDQASAWEEIKEDMQKSVPMDRLLVGDVGFGKTEIAFRAAFRAISNGMQVVMLVPTTILAEQHYETALERFKNFPVTIEMLSRFVSKQKQQQVIQKVKNADIEFLIGTHRVIQKDIVFAKLGLVIVDEEHRFGVKDKERIKQLKYNVDCLSMSATPIPRTLYQSLVQLRDLSSLHVAPKLRKPIQTHIEKFNEDTIKQAIYKELERDGQVFVLHNRVKTLDKMKLLLERLVPEATVLTASGQMNPLALEETMYQFTHGAANILVSTTIIENGIDIPRVNTIIIDRADFYGISQLYQLRGRVGRSDRQSYAYLLYPDDLTLSDLALKRLTVISDNTELGSGFNIAMRDLEVRGAGNLLGKEQSGSIHAIGYEYYMQLLDKTMKKMKHQDSEEEIEPVLEIEFGGFIPDTYIAEPSLKMSLYKQIISTNTIEEHQQLLSDIIDKYGAIPLEMQGLLSLSTLRIICKKLKITQLRERSHNIELHFQKLSLLPAAKIQQYVQDKKMKIHPTLPNVLLLPCDGLTKEQIYQHICSYFL